MYRWLLCFRYLRTRYIALASIVSVTLGVATLIVVNSVMAGFSSEMHERLHGLSSDIVIDCHTSGGMPNPEETIDQIMTLCGDDVVGASASVNVPAMLGIEFNGGTITRHVSLIGLDPATYDTVSHFSRYLMHPENKTQVSFLLRESGFAPDRTHFPPSGWNYRRARVAYERALRQERERVDALMGSPLSTANTAPPEDAGPIIGFQVPSEPLAETDGESATEFDAMHEQFPGVILGIATCSTVTRNADNEVVDFHYCRPGDDVRMMFPNAAEDSQVVNQQFTVVDLYESGMSEYDSSFAFCRLDQMQAFRGMIDPQTGVRSVTTIQLKLATGANLNAIRNTLRQRFPADTYAYNIQTWRDLQGPLLSAVRLETTILNILLFLIIAVAGFGILATFFMIVVEKTRDIGTLKALGASSRGVMSIFLSYGLLLGLVGSGAGLIGGLLFVSYINEIAGLVEVITGQEVFDPTVYYFTKIPTIVYPLTVAWVMVGAVAIAALASILPALRAARMHPVEALRFE